MPKIASGESLCQVCAHKGQVGIMRFNRIEKGWEVQTQMVYPPGGGESYVDTWFPCRYRVVKCERCGDEDAEYD